VTVKSGTRMALTCHRLGLDYLSHWVSRLWREKAVVKLAVADLPDFANHVNYDHMAGNPIRQKWAMNDMGYDKKKPRSSKLGWDWGS